MSDPYQAIYDAARSRMSNGNIGDAVADVIRQSVNFAVFENAARELLGEQTRPSVLHRPQLSADGNAWIALYGENLQTGVVGIGNSPEEAMRNFDVAWHQKGVTNGGS